MSGELKSGNEDRSALLRRAWELSLHLLATKLSKVTMETWIQPTVPLSYDETRVTLGVGSPFAREWLERKAANAIRSALEFHLDTTGLEIQFVVLTKEQIKALPKRPEKSRPAIEDGATQGALALDEPMPAPVESEPPRRRGRPPSASRYSSDEPSKNGPATIPSLPLNDRYVFENFLAGARSNRLAHAGAVAVSESPGSVYNPLFLYGPPGLGKTHLLQAITHRLRRDNHRRVAYVSGEYFAQHFIGALRERSTEQFRRQYREVDVWVVDDVQFIAGKEQTKEEFFHTFNALYQSGKQVVIASDRSPRELNVLDERLASRFQSGLIADIAPPELETRIAFLHHCREREQASVPEDVIEYIAESIQSNMRALEGAITRLTAYSSIMKTPIDAELAQSVLSEFFVGKAMRARKLTIDEIIEAVAKECGANPEVMKGPGRHKDIAIARHIAIYLCRELLPEINTQLTGLAFGGRDHATITYSYQRIRLLLSADQELQEMVNRLRERLISGRPAR